jgi:excisionase family DNA binding protein
MRVNATGAMLSIPHVKGKSMPPRFLQLADVSEILNISASQTYALVRSGDLPAIKVGGRGQWRVEATALEEYIQRCYAETKAFVAAHPLGGEEEPTG